MTGAVPFLSKSTWQWKFDGIQSSHKKVLSEEFDFLLEVPSQRWPGGGQGGRAAGALCCDERKFSNVRCLPQTEQLVSQSGSAQQRCFKVQWAWAMVRTVWNHLDEKERWSASSTPRQALRAQNPQPLDKAIALPSCWAAALPAGGLCCISAALSIFTQALLTALSCLSYLMGTTGNWVCFAL